jgi:hypothetical protein
MRRQRSAIAPARIRRREQGSLRGSIHRSLRRSPEIRVAARINASRQRARSREAIAIELTRAILLSLLAVLAIFVALPALFDIAHAALP